MTVRINYLYRDDISIHSKHKTMKKLLFCMFLLTGVSLSAQHSFYLSFQPIDRGIGIRMDEQRGDVGLYTAISYGNYKFKDGYISDHVRLTLGGIAYLEQSFVTAGLNVHSYGRHDFGEVKPAKAVLSPFSLELGVGTRLEGVSACFRIDLIKWDSSIDIGFNF